MAMYVSKDNHILVEEGVSLDDWTKKTEKDINDLRNSVGGDTGTFDTKGLLRNGSSNGHPGFTVKNPIKPCISFSDDDGKIGVYTKWKPILDEKNISMSLCIITNNVGNPDSLNWDQIRELQNVNGCEILSHTDNHANFNSRYNKDIKKMLKETKEILMKNGLRVNGFAYPNGGFYSKDLGEDVSHLCAEEYSYAIITQSTINKYPIKNSMKLDRAGIGCYEADPFKTLEGMKSKVDEVVVNNGWLILMTHVDDVGHTEEDTNNIRALIDYIKLKNVDIVTIKEGYKRFGNMLESDNSKFTNQGELIGGNNGGGGSYTLPIATSDDLGGVKIGEGIKILNGLISIDGDKFYNKIYIDEILENYENRIKSLEENSNTEVVNVNEVFLNKELVTLGTGKSEQLIKTINPTNATNKKTSWESSDNIIATVNSSGLVTGISEGKAIITVTTLDGNYKDTCSVIIEKNLEPIQLNYSTEGQCTKVSDMAYKIVDGAKWDSFRLLYDSKKSIAGNYNLCIEVLERNLTTSKFEIPTAWAVTHETAFKHIDLNTCKLNTVFRHPITIYENDLIGNASYIAAIQVANSNTGDVLVAKMWLEG